MSVLSKNMFSQLL